MFEELNEETIMISDYKTEKVVKKMVKIESRETVTIPMEKWLRFKTTFASIEALRDMKQRL